MILKLKKINCALITAMLMIVLCACRNDAGINGAATDVSTVTYALQTEADSEIVPTVTAEAASTQNAQVISADPTEAPRQTDTTTQILANEIDVDLTALSSTMVYSEVYNMMVTPENYIGKTVKMNGQFAVSQALDSEGNPDPQRIYFACIIADATACCSQGIEFVLSGEHEYPDDYPQPGSEITVLGTFQTYEEDGYIYCQLSNAEMQ